MSRAIVWAKCFYRKSARSARNTAGWRHRLESLLLLTVVSRAAWPPDAMRYADCWTMCWATSTAKTTTITLPQREILMNKSLVKVPKKHIENLILIIRGEKVILDSDLSELYQAETRALVQAVKRNIGRFPNYFMFQLTREEFESLRSQFVISKCPGGRRYLPYAFTEHGA